MKTCPLPKVDLQPYLADLGPPKFFEMCLGPQDWPPGFTFSCSLGGGTTSK